LADLFTPLFFADLSSAVWASLIWWSKNEFDDSVAHGRQTRLWRWAVDSFFPPCSCEAAILEESVGDHRHERVTVKALPGPALEVIKAKFFFQLLVCLLADPRGAPAEMSEQHPASSVGAKVQVMSIVPSRKAGNVIPGKEVSCPWSGASE
jgi:hypothetical protein